MNKRTKAFEKALKNKQKRDALVWDRYETKKDSCLLTANENRNDGIDKSWRLFQKEWDSELKKIPKRSNK